MQKVKLLYVEDEPFLGKIVRESLESRDFEVHMVTDGARVLDALKHFPPDICVLDVMLPNRDGFSLAAEIRQAALHKQQGKRAYGHERLSQTGSDKAVEHPCDDELSGFRHVYPCACQHIARERNRQPRRAHLPQPDYDSPPRLRFGPHEPIPPRQRQGHAHTKRADEKHANGGIGNFQRRAVLVGDADIVRAYQHDCRHRDHRGKRLRAGYAGDVLDKVMVLVV